VTGRRGADEGDWEQRYRAAAAERDALYATAAELSVDLERLRHELTVFETSRSVALAMKVADVVRVALPVGSRRRNALSKAVRLALGRPAPEERMHARYEEWLAARRPGPAELDRQRAEAASWARRPLVSICMPVYDPDPGALRQAAASVAAQSYDNWELCICDDASPRPAVGEVLDQLAAGDGRVKVVRAASNGGISRATNEALALASGEFVAFLDDDDLLEPHALHLFVAALQERPDIDVFYSDEDMLLPSGRRGFPFLKPGWSPETLVGMNYVTHFVMARRRLVDEVGGLRPERDGAQDHDLLLRLAEQTTAVHHVPEVLYSWRHSASSTAMTAEAKPWAYEAGRLAVEDALERRGLEGTVTAGQFPGAYHVRYAPPSPAPAVEILVPTRDRAELLGPCLASLQELTDYPAFTVTVLDNDSKEKATFDLLARHKVRVVPVPGPFNYSAIVNAGFAATGAEFVLTLNNDTRVVDPGWLAELVGLCALPAVGAVGCKLVFGDGRLQHEGIAVGCGVPAANLSFGAPGLRVVGAGISTTRDAMAVTGACSLFKRSAWEAIGGYDEAFAVAYNDVDFCIRLHRAGYRVLYTPYVALVHEESSSRGDLSPGQDEALLLRRWAPLLAAGDPYFSPRLTIGRYGLELASQEGAFRGRRIVDISLGAEAAPATPA
jgi:GT2 family glycosyltransferase